MEFYEALILVAVGTIAGFANTVAGGGSLLSLPVMIFMGLPPSVANASNRVAIFLQNVFAVRGFKSKGIDTWPYSGYLSVTSVIGAIIGAKISVEIDGILFSRILSVIMVLVMAVTVFNPLKKKDFGVERLDKNHRAIGIIAFFFIGIYGGFIQAGVGFMIIALLTTINHMRLVRVNQAKVVVAMVYTGAAILVFIYEDQINWLFGLTLAAGNSIGGWIGSRWQVDKGEKWIRRVIFVMVMVMAVKLWFFWVTDSIKCVKLIIRFTY